MTYFDDFCVIQDRTSRILIGAGKQREGVYYYKRTSSSQANTMNARCLWHKRLGHPSTEVLSYFSFSLGIGCDSNNEKEDVCEIRLRAKQTRNQFSISQSNAKDIFDLIHCDIWGPYKIPSLCGSHYFLSIVDDASRAT